MWHHFNHRNAYIYLVLEVSSSIYRFCIEFPSKFIKFKPIFEFQKFSINLPSHASILVRIRRCRNSKSWSTRRGGQFGVSFAQGFGSFSVQRVVAVGVSVPHLHRCLVECPTPFLLYYLYLFLPILFPFEIYCYLILYKILLSILS